MSFLFPDEFVVFFYRLGEVSSDELAERAVVEPEPPCQRLDAFGGRGVQAEGLAVFLHAVMCHHLAVVRPDHTQPGVQLRLVFFQVLPETFRMQPELGGDLCRRKFAFFQPPDSFGVFRFCSGIVLPHLGPVNGHAFLVGDILPLAHQIHVPVVQVVVESLS